MMPNFDVESKNFAIVMRFGTYAITWGGSPKYTVL